MWETLDKRDNKVLYTTHDGQRLYKFEDSDIAKILTETKITKQFNGPHDKEWKIKVDRDTSDMIEHMTRHLQQTQVEYYNVDLLESEVEWAKPHSALMPKLTISS